MKTQPRIEQTKRKFVHLPGQAFGKRQQVRREDAVSVCNRQTGNQSDTYREDDTSTLPPTPLHDHTSSLPCRVLGTSSMHAGCHSRRMTSSSSTVPFPLLTLNCHPTPTHQPHPPSPPRLPSLLGLTESWPGLEFTHTHTAHIHTQTDKKKGTHIFIHICSLKYRHPLLSLCFCDLHSAGNGMAHHSHHTSWLQEPLLLG